MQHATIGVLIGGLAALCFASAADATPTLIFQDSLAGTAGASIETSDPALGSAWTLDGLMPLTPFTFAGGGVQNVGQSTRDTNEDATSTLDNPFPLSLLAPTEVVHLQVTMANIAGTPSTNPLESSRVDLMTNTSGGFISAGELHTGGNWGANSATTNTPISSTVTTRQPGNVLLDLYLDPNDAFADGPSWNALLVVTSAGETYMTCGRIVDLSTMTQITAVRLVRNIDDAVFFDDVMVESLEPPLSSPCIADHLECYDVKDSKNVEALVDLNSPQFGLEANCSISSNNLRFCIPVMKTVRAVAVDKMLVSPLPVVGQPLVDDYICYKVKCTQALPANIQVEDQFANRRIANRYKVPLGFPVIQKLRRSELCVPARKVATPTPMVPSPTPTP